MFKTKINILKSFSNNSSFSGFTKALLKRFSVIGLDMGGTNTCIAVMELGGPRVIENAEGIHII